jgi:DegV family protein with EDD domain
VNLYAHLLSHYDSVIAVHLTGRFSGTLRNSQTAAEKVMQEFGKKITVVDSKNLSGALGIIISHAAKAIESGKQHEDVVKIIENQIGKTKIFVSVKDFKYMVRGGRVSPMKGRIAHLLNIKPIISMDEKGNSVLLDKAFSQKGNINKVMKHIRKIHSSTPVKSYLLLHARNPETADWIGENMQQLTGLQPIDSVDISPVVGLSAGRGAVAIAFDHE